MSEFTSGEFEKNIDDEVKDTSPRFSLVGELVEKDWIEMSSFRSLRFVSTVAPTGEKRGIRNRLQSQQLILGRLSEPRLRREANLLTYNVPISARPLRHDADSGSTSAYSYGDNKLFDDLGTLLGAVHNEKFGGYAVDAPIVDAVSMVEFTYGNEKKLFFVPGIERYLRSQKTQSLIESYTAQLSEAFDSFADFSDLFEEAFLAGSKSE